jgi:hypothetical protein
VAGVVTLAALVAGCGTVDVPASSATSADRAACRGLVAALPDRVSDQERRETSGNPLGAAWGDPAIVLRCGVRRPADQDQFAACQTVDGIDWFAPESASTDQSSDVVLTTIGREPRVEVVVPAELRPPAATMVDLAATIERHTRKVAGCS